MVRRLTRNCAFGSFIPMTAVSSAECNSQLRSGRTKTLGTPLPLANFFFLVCFAAVAAEKIAAALIDGRCYC